MTRKRKIILLLVVLAASGSWLYVFDPARQPELFVGCPFHAITGLDCPGCGTTRAVHYALHGDFLRAFHVNPLAVLILPMVLLAVVPYALRDILGYSIPHPRVPNSITILLLVVISAFWIFRNLPLYPFR